MRNHKILGDTTSMSATVLFGEHKNWEAVIGLEIHAQIQSKSKLLSGSSTNFGAEQNSHVSLFDCAMPGTLPIVNMYCIEQAVKTGLAVNGEIQKHSVFDRKHYFYPDLPNGYQISQFYNPAVIGGKILIETNDGSEKVVNLERIHIEQDAGKSIHDLSPKFSHIDLNRAGVGLMEIVSKPEISSPQEAVNYIKKLQLIMRYIGSCDGNMEMGNLRCDANVSIRKVGEKLGTRCEIKNLNSTRNIELAIEFEIKRQIMMLESGEKIECQTRLFDTDSGETKLLRTKEDANDYRYFPDNDLLPVNLTDEYIQSIKSKLPKLPDERKSEYLTNGIKHEALQNLVNNIDMCNYFDEVVSTGISHEAAINWVNVEVLARMNKENITSFKDLPRSLTANNLSELLKLIDNSTINGKIAKDVLDKMFEFKSKTEYLTPAQIVEKNGLGQITDLNLIESKIEEVLKKNPEKVKEYRSGKTNLFGFFVGQTMKSTEGKANPDLVNEILKQRLN